MKKITIAILAFTTLLATSCSVNGLDGRDGFDGLDGRDGIDGVDGQDGINILGQVIDIEGDFTAQDDYSIFYEFPQSIEVFETDVVLVYILFDQTEDSNGEAVDIWRLLPQTIFLDQGLLQYNYDHTFLDVNIFLDANFDLETLQSGDTDNQIFRIAVLPADSASKSNVDHSDMSEVLSKLGVDEKDIQRVKLN